jgi:hypothetical protein
MRACAKQFFSASTSTILIFRWTIVASGLPFRLIAANPNPTGFQKEWTVTISVSNALNLELDCVTLSKTFHITSDDNWSLRLKLKPIGVSLWFTSLCIVIPTISASPTSFNTWSNRLFTLSIKWLTGPGGADVSEMIGGLRRTFPCVPRVLNLLYSLVCTSSISNVCCCDISHHRCVLTVGRLPLCLLRIEWKVRVRTVLIISTGHG